MTKTNKDYPICSLCGELMKEEIKKGLCLKCITNVEETLVCHLV